LCFFSGGAVRTVFSQSVLPSERFRHISTRALLSGRYVVTKTRSPQTTGDEWPFPGIGIFQATFSVPLQRVGTSVSAERPSPCGPRHMGQSAAVAVALETHRSAARRDGRTALGIIYSP
jgi:hypothetical protein